MNETLSLSNFTVCLAVPTKTKGWLHLSHSMDTELKTFETLYVDIRFEVHFVNVSLPLGDEAQNDRKVSINGLTINCLAIEVDSPIKMSIHNHCLIRTTIRCMICCGVNQITHDAIRSNGLRGQHGPIGQLTSIV